MAVIDDHRRDQIRLSLPAEAAYGRLARIAATTLARRLGFGFRAIEDLGLALDETLIFLLSVGTSTADDSLDVVLDVRGEDLAVGVTLLSGTGEPPTGFASTDRARFSELVGETVAEWGIDDDAATVNLLARR